MKSYLASMFSAQTPPPGSQEGLPYWILWFLLCVILLLFSFIFLRDKDLRQRLNQFLFGAKKRLIKFRLHTRLKIARRKIADVYRELGQKAWEENLDVPESEKLSRTLHKLDEKKVLLHEDLESTLEKISNLKKNYEDKSFKYNMKISGKKAELKIENEKLSEIRNKIKEIRSSLAQKKKEAAKLEKELHVLDKNSNEIKNNPKTNEVELKQKMEAITGRKAEIEILQQQIKQDTKELKRQINEQENEDKALKELIHGESMKSKEFEATSRREQDEIKKEINEWDRHRVKIQEKIQRIEKRKVPLFENMGSLADSNRIEHESLMLFYSQIDRTNKKIEDIERQLEELD